LAVVIYGLQCIRISINSDMSDLGCRYQPQHPFYHSKACPQNSDNPDFFPGNNLSIGCTYWSFHLNLFQWQVARDFISHQSGDLRDEISKILRARVLIPDKRQFMLDKGMIN